MSNDTLLRNIDGYARLAFVQGMTRAINSLGISKAAYDEFEAIWDQRNPSMRRDAIVRIKDTAEMIRVSERMEHELVTCFRELLKRRAPNLFEETP